MPAPTAADGAARGIKEIAVPSGFAVFIVIMTYHFYGSIMAGLLLFGITIFGFVVLASVAKYWNANYTIGFVSVGFFSLLIVPSVLGEIVHPIFSVLNSVAALAALIGIGSLLLSKLNLGQSSIR